ncbi:MAG: putative Ig domain-containing protein, partial [Eubacteriales bacterium]|nr:putative Ig domain-containing protein [Eubacteriales bacterium]
LVDAYNGNVWVTNGTYGGMDIYLPYPDDISEADKTSTDFRLLYLDVDREYGINGNPTMEDMLRNAEVKELDYDTKDNGIKTTIARNEVVGGIYILAHATKVNYLNFEDLAFYLEEGQSTEDRIANFPLLRWSITNSEGTKEIDLVNSDEAKFTIGENDDPWVAENVADPFPFNLTFWNDDGEELTLATSYENMIGTFHARLKPKDGVTNLKLNGALLKSGSLGALTIAPLVDDNPRESFVPVDTAAPTEPVTDKPVTVIPAGTKILVNGEYELKDEAKAQISLLVDHIQKEENEFGKAIKQRLMDDGKVTSIDPSKTGFTIRYLDLVDENDGNVWVKLADNAEMTVYLPYPDGDKSRTYKMFRFSDMHRAYGFDGTEIQNAIDTSRIDEIELEKTELGLKLSVDNLGPFVLTWEIATEPEGKAPSIITETLASGREGSSYSQKLTVTGDTPLTYTVSEGKLPDGLSLSADGTISGRPSARGTYTFTITVSNAAGTDSRQFTIEISRRSGNGSSDSDSGSGGSGSGSSRSWTAGIDGQWVHMDPENFEIPISQDVPAGATPVTSPKWHTWKFYLTNGGILRNGWNYIKNPYASNGQPKEGWFTFDEDGIMQYGWYLSAAGKWYYLHRESDGMLGTMETGWHYDDQDGKWYYLDPRSGEMLLGWQKIDGKWYYFNPTGVASTWNHSEATGGWTFNGSAARPFGSMYVNEVTPDGYQVGADGARIE